MNVKTLTLVIPSKGRPKRLASLLNFFAASQLSYPLLVLISKDGFTYSKEQYPGLDIQFVEFPAEIDLFEKIKQGLKYVKTPLVSYCTDDDIFLVSALYQAAAFLTNHPEYSACQGYHALFSQQESEINLLKILYFTPSR